MVVFHDPGPELARRAARWGHTLGGVRLADLATFASGLALAEAEAWDAGAPDLATRAHEARRFLLADRVIHWAVPWLDSIGTYHPSERQAAVAERDLLLALGDTHRVAPAIPGREGLHLPGEDSFGPTEVREPLATWVTSLWSGMVHDEPFDSPRRLASEYAAAAASWSAVAALHPGSAELWTDLAQRAIVTAECLART